MNDQLAADADVTSKYNPDNVGFYKIKQKVAPSENFLGQCYKTYFVVIVDIHGQAIQAKIKCGALHNRIPTYQVGKLQIDSNQDQFETGELKLVQVQVQCMLCRV